jgi:hypothetical protein
MEGMMQTLASTPRFLGALVCALALSSGISTDHVPHVGAQQSSPAALARLAVSADAAEAERAIAALRTLGQTGHAALLAEHAADVARLRDAPPLTASAPLERLRHAIDLVSGQRDGHASGLYFHTDLDAALAEARRRGVPVLSLRMLGRLHEEMSCANSRYFRTLLYPDESVARVLRERFVLHVSMERPAPRITIDMGDGRTMVRTITGNSVHYVLDGKGRVIDAIPGLYAPGQFIAALDAASRRVVACGALEGTPFSSCIVSQHRAALDALGRQWALLRTANPSMPTYEAFVRAVTPARSPSVPSARNAMVATMSKMVVETPVLDRVSRTPTLRLPDPVDFVALSRTERRPLGSRSLALLRLKAATDDVAGLADSLSTNATADGLRNELMMHRRIHALFVEDPSLVRFEALNERVYTEIFLTPAGDPRLGLRADDVWDAIETLH